MQTLISCHSVASDLGLHCLPLSWVYTVCQCPGSTLFANVPCSPGLTDNPLYTTFWLHSHKNSAAISNHYLDFVLHAVWLHYRDQKCFFHALTFARSWERCWKPWPDSFQHLPRHLANVNALKKHVWLLLLHKNWKHLLHFALFLTLFCFTFHRCLANAISMDNARSRAVQYTSRNGSKSVALVWSYWKLRSHALRACELPC